MRILSLLSIYIYIYISLSLSLTSFAFFRMEMCPAWNMSQLRNTRGERTT